MINLVLVRGADRGLFPATLLPLCADQGINIKTIPEHAAPGPEDLVLVDYPEPGDSLAYIRNLRAQGISCFPLLVAPESSLPPFTELSALRISSYIPTPVKRDAVVTALQQAAAQVHLFRNLYVSRSDYTQLKRTLDTLNLSRLYILASSDRFRAPASLKEFNVSFGTNFPSTQLACFGIQVDPLTAAQPAPHDPVWSYLQDDIAAFFEAQSLYAVQLRIAGFCGYLFTPAGQSVRQLAGRLFDALQKVVLPGDQLTIGCAGPTDSLSELPALLQETVSALRNRINLGVGQVIDLSEWDLQELSVAHLFTQEKLVKLYASTDVGDVATLEKYLANAIEELRQIPALAAKSIYTAAIRFYELFRDSGLHRKNNDTHRSIDSKFFSELDWCWNMEMVLQTLTRWCHYFLDEGNESAVPSGPISMALQYIEHNLDKPMSLQSLAQQVHLSPSYYSSLFKQQVGCTFCEYVQTRRISTSISLLVETQLTVAEIARRVGFSDYRYFSRLFSRIVGMNPTQYRKRHRPAAQETH